ncbi:hypothetical protein Cco03nite_23620 [Catellatospora coxensis]|uniref:Uncharacterized protein n=1 Tax=Catellatospora coxensis TaxID=310354 RepID=A0A8J3KSZ5_9ACTN|nr:hypothetical protein Cco03nite_23620 [Catellatospora coxensis]
MVTSGLMAASPQVMAAGIGGGIGEVTGQWPVASAVVLSAYPESLLRTRGQGHDSGGQRPASAARTSADRLRSRARSVAV